MHLVHIVLVVGLITKMSRLASSLATQMAGHALRFSSSSASDFQNRKAAFSTLFRPRLVPTWAQQESMSNDGPGLVVLAPDTTLAHALTDVECHPCCDGIHKST